MEKNKSVYAHYVSGAPVQMSANDVLDILQDSDGKVDYMQNLRNKLMSKNMSTLQAQLFPSSVCPSGSSTILNFLGGAVETPAKVVGVSDSLPWAGSVIVLFGLCAFLGIVHL